MTTDYLSASRNKIERNHPHLLSLLNPEEINILEEDIPCYETPIWRYWEQYVVKTLILGKSPITVRGVRDTLNIIIRHTGLFTIEQINAPKALGEALLRLQIERNQKASTRNSYIKAVNTYFIWLYKNHFIEQNNISRIERGREIPSDIKPLTLDQVQKIVVHIGTRKHTTALERARNILMIDILRFSGIRPCELLGMETDSIFQENGKWKMLINGRKQKGRKRYYEAPSFLVYSYQNYMKLRDEIGRWETPLFISMSSREGWQSSGMQNLFKKISKELGFRVTAYGFRRFIASHLNKLGIKRDHLSRYMGHTKFSTTDIYIARECYLTHNGSKLLENTYRANDL